MNVKIVELKFVNEEVDNPELVYCDVSSIDFVMEMYGAFYAGEQYKVFVDGKPVEKDMNGGFVPLTIDAETIGKPFHRRSITN